MLEYLKTMCSFWEMEILKANRGNDMREITYCCFKHSEYVGELSLALKGE